jgi:AraC family transcriptional regulator of adaptative response/methylated-DNA-[protein]-cysteine methyltransferase
MDAANRWHAVASRDRTSDGAFVYGVRSTGVYCRPSCPSRRPRRDRVLFFDRPGDAERAGYRPCRRCRPQDGAQGDPWVERIARACGVLARSPRPLGLTALASQVGGSPWHLHRNFKRLVGLTPRQYAEACRLRRMKRKLRTGVDVTTAVVEAGYGSGSRFYERAAPMLGMAPSQYRKGGAGMRIQFTIVDSPLGRLLVGATAKGVCAVAMGTSDAELERSIAAEYPAAHVTAADGGKLAAWTRRILAHLADRQPRLELPLDVRATAFQWRVWTALAAIPYGATRTYGDVAAAIGRPGAARAVARACATNPVALAVPCHRVVPATGGIGGYRWGPARKRRLLARESGD